MRLFRVATLTVIALLAVSGITYFTVSAQSSSGNASQGIQISPTIYELNAERGKTYEIKLNVMNVTVSDLLYTVSVEDFTSSDETGSPHIIIDSDLPETASIKTWVSVIPEFELKTRESSDISASITIPNNAEPGGHYGVLRFSGTAPDIKSTGVGLSASAGVLILIRVDGDITELASLASFYTAKNDNQSFFFEEGPIDIVTRLKNEGNVHVKPSGTVEVRDMFGGLSASFPINQQVPKSNILPDSIRRFDVTMDNQWMFGKYTADLILGYGTTGQAITNTISFWVIPYKLILAAVAVLVTLVYVFKRMIKAYNKRITEKVKNEIAKQNKNKGKKKE
jgi:hypothetical protein